MRNKLRVFFVLCIAAMAAHPVQAQQQQYPSRPIEIVVPFGAGSTGDILARLIGASYSKEFGQPVVVQNQPGAGGTIGSAAVARAKNDGHTLVLGTIASHGIGALMFPSATYDAAKDFEPITLIANAPNMLVVHRSIPVSTAAEFVEYTKKVGGVNFTSGGAGTTSQFAGELLRMQLGANLVHVSYKAAGQGLSDVIAGTLPAMIWQIPPLKAHIAAGSLKAIAAMSARRIAGFPNVPTIAETLIPGFDSNAWFGLLAPGGTPKPIVERLHAATLRAMESPEMKQTFETQALEPSGVGLEKFRELIRADLAKWKPVVEAVKPAR